LGIAKTKEINSGNATGLAWFPSFQDPDTQTRSFARTAHYDPAKQRSNYHLLAGHKVLNINITDDLRADGVTFQQRNTTGAEKIHVKAKREVILAAGALHSPQILQRSGIGPKSLLQRAGIQTKVDLPGVGQNLQDHAFLIVPFQCKDD
jgi:choline dehydrogenase-like flavoprotein